ncbi:MAG: hypothetical protein LRZ84_14635 [Desertifilum sp.]|nr:hypothetical protein [Desertifilum sp.]
MSKELETDINETFDRINRTLERMQNQTNRPYNLEINAERSEIDPIDLKILQAQLDQLKLQAESAEIMAQAAFDLKEAEDKDSKKYATTLRWMKLLITGSLAAGVCGLVVLVIRPAQVNKGVELGFLIGNSAAALVMMANEDDS